MTEKIRKPRRPATHPVWRAEWGRCSLPHNKRRYPTRSDARFALRKMPVGGAFYRCAACGDLHLTRNAGVPAFRLAAAIRYLEESLRDDQRQVARARKGDHVPA